MSHTINLIDQKFGRLTVLRYNDRDKNGNSRWLCRCNCGKETIVLGNNLKRNHTQSCGCLWKEVMFVSHIKHGHHTRVTTTELYAVWAAMIQRCTNPNNKQWKDYGGRGITVCNRWRKFEDFLEDMGEPPLGLTIERIKNDKGYCLDNCYWATPKEQARNRRSNHLITCFGKIQCIAAWSEETGIPHKTLRRRITELNWSPKRALTSPVRKYKQKGTKNV